MTHPTSVRTAWTIVLALALVAVFVSAVVAASNQTMEWWTIAGGGGEAHGGVYRLEGTAGQAVIGEASGGDHDLCAGFWCAAGPTSRTHLPLLTR
jgi:hypothetical protein